MRGGDDSDFFPPNSTHPAAFSHSLPPTRTSLKMARAEQKKITNSASCIFRLVCSVLVCEKCRQTLSLLLLSAKHSLPLLNVELSLHPAHTENPRRSYMRITRELPSHQTSTEDGDGQSFSFLSFSPQTFLISTLLRVAKKKARDCEATAVGVGVEFLVRHKHNSVCVGEPWIA